MWQRAKSFCFYPRSLQNTSNAVCRKNVGFFECYTSWHMKQPLDLNSYGRKSCVLRCFAISLDFRRGDAQIANTIFCSHVSAHLLQHVLTHVIQQGTPPLPVTATCHNSVLLLASSFSVTHFSKTSKPTPGPTLSPISRIMGILLL